jgi:predicted signal transduction protein with EAL and GGDEF domain
MEELRDLGVVVSIDDFGAGFTSLAYLGDLAVDELKLDGVFIIDLAVGNKERDIELVRATIELGHAMGLRVVAECIEDKNALTCFPSSGVISARATSSAGRRRATDSPSDRGTLTSLKWFSPGSHRCSVTYRLPFRVRD